MKSVIVIPARYDSTRLPGKPLLRETGKYLIQHVWEAARKIKGPSRVIIATDDQRIIEAVKSFGAEAVMTSPECRTGTDRVAEVVKNLKTELIINLQGDEPEIDAPAVENLVRAMEENPNTPMGTLGVKHSAPEGLENPSVVKIAVGRNNMALYFSRALVPHHRDDGDEAYWRHLGVYAFRRNFLREFVKMPSGLLEETEKLEQLRALENGARILVVEAERAAPGIDTPEEYAAFVERWKAAAIKG